MNTTRTTFIVLALGVGLSACSVTKSVGEEGTTSSGEVPPAASASSVGPSGPGGSGAGMTSGWPGSASVTSTSGLGTGSAGVTTEWTGGPACGVEISTDDGDLTWECLCATCTLTYEGLTSQTLQLFEQQNLCECLCPANGCGEVQGAGGVGGSSSTGFVGVTTDFSTTGTDMWSTTTGSGSLTFEACEDEGGVIVGDPGDGSVFEPDYVCPGGEAPLGWIEFEPGMPFPRNGGVCCPPDD